jgi:hypothetical protein
LASAGSDFTSKRWTWLPRLAATSLPSGDTATARTGFTSAGGRSTMILRFTRAIVGIFAPSSIHSFRSESSCDVSGSSLFGGMIGFFCRLHIRKMLLSADLPGTIAGPRLPPFITPA